MGEAQSDKAKDNVGDATPEPRKPLTPAAERALAEAKARRAAAIASPPEAEFGGRGGLDPVRYGDWEKKGIASDF